MNIESNRAWSAVPRTSSVRALRSIVFLSALSLSAAAQSTRVVVSTTDDVAPAAGVPFNVTDGDLVAVEPGMPVSPYFADGHFHATSGIVPSDIDAFAHAPGARAGTAESIVFSLLSNEGGFLDGDVLALTRGGGAATLRHSELDFAVALGAPGANIDIDALAYDDAGRMLFSLADNLGAILDGDIFRLDSATSATLLLSESDVQTRFTQATGLADAILDVQALAWGAGELWTSVQSPSRHDGSVIALNGIPRVVFDENDLGLGGAEVDALSELFPQQEIPVFHMSKQTALPGDSVHVEARGRPGALCYVYMAGRSGFVDTARFGGFGGLYVDRFDPWLTALRTTSGLPTIRLDGTGRYAIDWALPTVAVYGLGPIGEEGWSFQLLEFGPMRFSAPFRIEKL